VRREGGIVDPEYLGQLGLEVLDTARVGAFFPEISPSVKSSRRAAKALPGLVALQTAVFTLPWRSVNQITTRLFSEQRYFLSRMA
jgi:hypothetical protein